MRKKLLKMECLGGFDIFSVNLRFSEMPAGQQIRAMLSVFNILTHEVDQKFELYFKKLIKIGKILVFCHFRG